MDNQTIVTDHDRELAAYWTERGDLRAWLAHIIAAARNVEMVRCVAIIRKHEMNWDDAIDEIENG